MDVTLFSLRVVQIISGVIWVAAFLLLLFFLTRNYVAAPLGKGNFIAVDEALR
jgi:hypothetical protein